MRAARKCHVITGLPDAYGRGRIIGDYRRVALYGVDKLIAEKKKDKAALANANFNTDQIRLDEELFQQITFLGYMKEMAAMYGFDISAPAANAKEAIQWTYFAYRASIKEQNGALASLNSVAKISYDDCRDGISNTFSITPDALGKTEEERINNLVTILDGYFAKNAHHINVNVLNRETLMKAYENPEDYPNLTIRVSGYAVNFNKLSREHQREVISRTFHETM